MLATKVGRSYRRGALLEVGDDTLDASEYIPVEQEGEVKRREQNWLNGESDDEDDEEFGWIDDISDKDEQENTYFTFVNETREVMKAGT